MNKTLLTIAGIVIAFAIGYAISGDGVNLGAAPDGLNATHDASAATTSGPDVVRTLSTAANSFGCTARAVSVTDTSRLTFDASLTPASGVGLLQTASTTVVYDSGQYGCGTLKIWSQSTSTTYTSVFK